MRQMRRDLVMVAALAAAALLIPVAPILAQTESTTVVTVNATAPGGSLRVGENILFHEAWISEQKLPSGVVVGPHPIYFNDGGYGEVAATCSFAQGAAEAQAAGVEWIGMIERGSGGCTAYQTGVSAAESAGASGLIFGNNEANSGGPVQPAAEGVDMVAGMVDYNDAQRILATRLGASDPMEVRITLQFLTFEVEEDLPPRPKGYSPPPQTGTGFGSGFDNDGDGFGIFGFGDESVGLGDPETPGDTEVILVPGPDGELIEMEIPVYAQQAAEKSGLNPLIPVTISLVLIAFILGGFFFLRARRGEEEIELGH